MEIRPVRTIVPGAILVLIFVLVAILVSVLKNNEEFSTEPYGPSIGFYLADGTLVSGSDVIAAIEKCSGTHTVIEVTTCAGETSVYNWDGTKEIGGYVCTDRNAPEYINPSAVFKVEAADGKVILTQQKGGE